MKIWFRIGLGRDNEQDGPQPPERYSSAASQPILTKQARKRESAVLSGWQISTGRKISIEPII
jgi:hypothetical protein